MVKADIKCEICEGTGEVADLNFDEDSKQWIEDGVRDCVCVEDRKQDD